MDSFLFETGIRVSDFLQISTLYVLTLLVFFTKDKRFPWLNYFLLAVFCLQCLFIILFRDGLEAKFFGALMLISILTIEFLVVRRRKQHSVT